MSTNNENAAGSALLLWYALRPVNHPAALNLLSTHINHAIKGASDFSAENCHG
jgi:hypothetical protein